ncbi:MAG TPA: hypothetical protein VIM51_11455 [Desulfosporosinus sp.]
MQQAPGTPSESFKLSDRRFLRDAIQGISNGTWREQLKQALENGPYQAETLKSMKAKQFEETENDYAETEGTQGVEGTQGIEGTSEYVGILGEEGYKSTKASISGDMVRNPSDLSDVHLSLTERELVQGVMWAEILGKPRAMRPFRGPRT